MTVQRMGQLTTRFCADVVLLDLCCAQLTETPILLPDRGAIGRAIHAIRSTYELVDSLLVPAIRGLHGGLHGHLAGLSELLELLPYLHAPPGRSHAPGSSVSIQIRTTLESTLRRAETEHLNLADIRSDLLRASRRLMADLLPPGAICPEALNDFRAELTSCAEDPRRRPRLRVLWSLERGASGQLSYRPGISLVPTEVVPLIPHARNARRSAPARVPVSWVAELVSALRQTLAWLHADVGALEAAWVSTAAELKAAAAAVDWSPSDRLRVQSQLLAQLRDTEASVTRCASAYRWLLHFDAAALIHPLPAMAEG